jgi:predicted site-specific integrase-resolvase
MQYIGSDLNFKRKGFFALLELAYQGFVEEQVVSHRDRLCRFGFEPVDFIFSHADTRLVVHSKVSQGSMGTGIHGPVVDRDAHITNDGGRARSARDELTDEILSIVAFFTPRYNEMRSAHNRQERKRARASRDESEGAQAILMLLLDFSSSSFTEASESDEE